MHKPLPASYRALRIHQQGAGVRAGFETLPLAAPAAGMLTVRVEWSSVNYKDALAASGRGRILRRFPLTGGIDLAGSVVASADARHAVGARVLVTGCGLSETRDGGYAEYATVEAADAITLPDGLDTRSAMIYGTAGFTAGLALLRMEQNGQTPAAGPIAVTGASGGVGMLAVAIFARAGYRVSAFSGKPQHADFLRELGAAEVLPREALPATPQALQSARYAGAVDVVGGTTLATLLACCAPYGNVAACGLVGDSALHTTVMPLIIRGVSLLGIASAQTPHAQRAAVWQQLADDWRPPLLQRIATREIAFDQLPQVFDEYLNGAAFGRTLVRIGTA